MKSERVQKLCSKMKEYGVDQVIVTSKANVFYFSGAYMIPCGVCWHRSSMQTAVQSTM